jgi:small multidrug resistance pump
MKKWLLLAGAIISEVAGSLALKPARTTRPGTSSWRSATSARSRFSRSFYARMALGVAYGIWGAMGVALTAVLAALLFGQPLTGVMILGLALIIGGVLTVELGSQAAQRQEEASI